MNNKKKLTSEQLDHLAEEGPLGQCGRANEFGHNWMKCDECLAISNAACDEAIESLQSGIEKMKNDLEERGL